MMKRQQQKNFINLGAEEDLLRSQDADLQSEAATSKERNMTKAAPATLSKSSCPFAFIPLKLTGRTHVPSSLTKALFRNEKHQVSLTDLQRMTDLFYEKAFQDETLDKFIRSHDDPHGQRFAKWIHQKLAGSTVWDDERRRRDPTPVVLAEGMRHRVHDRSSAHVAAWYSPKRPVEDVGRHFQLDECRVWMRLHFWALRESGLLEQSPTFADYYVRFIAHFVRVYESTAPIFARDSFRWSANPDSIEAYLTNGRRMSDVLGLSVGEAESQIPEDEANDFVWPYHTSTKESI